MVISKRKFVAAQMKFISISIYVQKNCNSLRKLTKQAHLLLSSPRLLCYLRPLDTDVMQIWTDVAMNAGIQFEISMYLCLMSFSLYTHMEYRILFVNLFHTVNVLIFLRSI